MPLLYPASTPCIRNNNTNNIVQLTVGAPPTLGTVEAPTHTRLHNHCLQRTNSVPTTYGTMNRMNLNYNT